MGDLGSLDAMTTTTDNTLDDDLKASSDSMRHLRDFASWSLRLGSMAVVIAPATLNGLIAQTLSVILESTNTGGPYTRW